MVVVGEVAGWGDVAGEERMRSKGEFVEEFCERTPVEVEGVEEGEVGVCDEVVSAHHEDIPDQRSMQNGKII